MECLFWKFLLFNSIFRNCYYCYFQPLTGRCWSTVCVRILFVSPLYNDVITKYYYRDVLPSPTTTCRQCVCTRSRWSAPEPMPVIITIWIGKYLYILYFTAVQYYYNYHTVIIIKFRTADNHRLRRTRAANITYV